ncbi:MAG: CoA-binding protein, partial [Candidatus Micrarchaeota archaeon]
HAVNPNAKSILGVKCVASVLDIRESVDMAIVCTPANTVLQIAGECGRKGVKALLVVSAGFAEMGNTRLQEELAATCRKHKMRLLGPNCMGILAPHRKLNASFGLTAPTPGGVAFVSQSGAIADSAIDWAVQERYAFSLIASLGNSADVDAADVLEWLEHDKNTKVITLYLESVADGRKLLKVARRASRSKPIIAIKGGRTGEGIKAAGSHTGALASDYRVFAGAMRQAGVKIAESIEEMFDLAIALQKWPSCGNSIAIITNGGGAGVLAADYCGDLGMKLARLAPATIRKLDESGKMHPAYSRSNPLDIIGDALPERYAAALDTVLQQEDVAAVAVIQTLQTMTDPVEDARAIIAASRKHPRKPVIAVFMGGKYTAPGVKLLAQAGIPTYNDP